MRLESSAPRQHAGAGHGETLRGRQSQTEIAGIASPCEAKCMAAALRRQKDAGVLHAAVGIKRAGADDADLRPLLHVPAARRASRVDDLDVVIEEQQEFATRFPAARLLKRDQLNASSIAITWSAFSRSQRFQCRLLGRDVLDTDDLEIRIGGRWRAGYSMQVLISPRAAQVGMIIDTSAPVLRARLVRRTR